MLYVKETRASNWCCFRSTFTALLMTASNPSSFLWDRAHASSRVRVACIYFALSSGDSSKYPNPMEYLPASGYTLGLKPSWCWRNSAPLADRVLFIDVLWLVGTAEYA